jgi:hypothetical protein
MRKLLFLIIPVALLGACCNNSNKTTTTASTVTKECESISVDSFLVIAGDYVDKELTVKGTVDHVCKHGGKRVKIFSSCASKTIHGEAGEGVGPFNVELEGSDVCLTGTVLETRIDMAYVDEWEAKEKEAMEQNAEESEMEHKEGVDHHAKLDEIKKHREEIEASEKGYIAFYALNVTKFHECKTSTTEEVVVPTNGTATPCCSDKKEDKDCESAKKESAQASTPCGQNH